jgi:hypothetical protein
MKIKNFNYYMINEDGETTGTVGSGSAVGGSSAEGSFTTSAGNSTGNAYANLSQNGMGSIISATPSPIPGDVAGGKSGSGDIGTVLNASTKPTGTYNNTNKKGKKPTDSKITKLENQISNMYVVRFADFDYNKTLKENVYTPEPKIICQECGEEVCNNLNDQIGHLRNKHNIKNTERDDQEIRRLLPKYFYKSK